MDKRGISLTLIVFELAIVTLVFYMLGGLVQKTSASEYFSNAVLAEDSALFIDTLYAAPGNARIIYHNDLAGKPVSFSDNQVSIGDAKAGFVSSEHMLDGELKNASVLPLVKAGGVVSLDQWFDPARDVPSWLECNDIMTTDDLKQKKILLDPSHGGADHGDEYNEISAAAASSKIAYAFSIQNSAFIQNLVFSRPLEEDISKDAVVSIDDRMENAKGRDLIISIDTGADILDPSTQRVIAYYSMESSSADKAAKLSCLILNSLIQQIGATSASMVPLSKQAILSDPQYQMLTAGGKVNVLIKIGNVYHAKDDNILKKETDIGRAIYAGVEQYYR